MTSERPGGAVPVPAQAAARLHDQGLHVPAHLATCQPSPLAGCVARTIGGAVVA